eukprot:GHVL01035589.1.p1 GENE.GHVL01035589.1~~GHVL01035589.1.p1  ORF type:complete len:396 (+),score=95.39 GHVL01035589.1:158-1345(+)
MILQLLFCIYLLCKDSDGEMIISSKKKQLKWEYNVAVDIVTALRAKTKKLEKVLIGACGNDYNDLSDDITEEPGEERRVIAIGSVNGDLEVLKSILRNANVMDKKEELWVGGNAIVVMLGDIGLYGPESTELYIFINFFREEARKKKGLVIPLLGARDAEFLVPSSKSLKENLNESELHIFLGKTKFEKIKKMREYYEKDECFGKILRSFKASWQYKDILFTNSGLTEEMTRLSDSQLDSMLRLWIDKSSKPSKLTHDEETETELDSKGPQENFISKLWTNAGYAFDDYADAEDENEDEDDGGDGGDRDDGDGGDGGDRDDGDGGDGGDRDDGDGGDGGDRDDGDGVYFKNCEEFDKAIQQRDANKMIIGTITHIYIYIYIFILILYFKIYFIYQ